MRLVGRPCPPLLAPLLRKRAPAPVGKGRPGPLPTRLDLPCSACGASGTLCADGCLPRDSFVPFFQTCLLPAVQALEGWPTSERTTRSTASTQRERRHGGGAGQRASNANGVLKEPIEHRHIQLGLGIHRRSRLFHVDVVEPRRPLARAKACSDGAVVYHVRQTPSTIKCRQIRT